MKMILLKVTIWMISAICLKVRRRNLSNLQKEDPMIKYKFLKKFQVKNQLQYLNLKFQ